MSILIGADIVPSFNNEKLFSNGNVELLFGFELGNILKEADFRVFNLEAPLTNLYTPIEKCGPNLRADCSTIVGIKKMGVDLFTLANNHIMDYGNEALKSTISLLNFNKINHLGAGENLKQAQKPFIVKIKGITYGFYACAEHEFSIAERNTPGANPFDPLESFDHVADLSKSCDYTIVLYHGGKEHYRYPSPMLQRVCRKFVEKGADFVVCQHSHCIGCEEKYMKGSIIYGQGNFLFNSSKGPFVETSLLIRLNDDFSIDYLPLAKTEYGISLANGAIAKEILSSLKKRSELIQNTSFVENEYKKFAKKKFKDYMLACSGYAHKPVLRFLNKISGRRYTQLIVNSYKKKELLAIRNFIECESHRELWTHGLKEFIYKI